MNRNLQRTYRKVLYNMKKMYGDAITICRNTSVSTNYTTGVKSYVCTRYKINKAVLLPDNFERKTNYTLSMISADKMFVFGGTFDIGSKIIIVDTRDLPEFFQLTNDDYILIDNIRYNVSKIEQLEYQAGWIIAAKQIAGVTPDLEVSLNTSDSVGLNDSVVTPDLEISLNTSDSVGLNDSVVRTIDMEATDSMSISDVFTRTIDLDAVDSLSISDVPIRTIDMEATDSMSMSEDVSSII